uniref:Uncharacterized protein n=2 Tax=Micrurus TaxID=8634 RepID=A0A2D4IQG1_MICLE
MKIVFLYISFNQDVCVLVKKGLSNLTETIQTDQALNMSMCVQANVLFKWDKFCFWVNLFPIFSYAGIVQKPGRIKRLLVAHSTACLSHVTPSHCRCLFLN